MFFRHISSTDNSAAPSLAVFALAIVMKVPLHLPRRLPSRVRSKNRLNVANLDNQSERYDLRESTGLFASFAHAFLCRKGRRPQQKLEHRLGREGTGEVSLSRLVAEVLVFGLGRHAVL